MNDSQNSSTALALDSETRASLWKLVAGTIETYLQTVDELPVSPHPRCHQGT